MEKYDKRKINKCLILDKLIIQKDINYLYKTILFPIKSFNITINIIIIFILGFYIFPYAIILLHQMIK